MNKAITNSIRFVIMVLLQVLVFNNVNLLGHINPMPYILWILIFPIKKNRLPYLFGAFALGISIDFFSDSGGINAASSLLIAYVRLSVLKFVLRKRDIDFSSFGITTMSLGNLLYYTVLLVFIHHITVFGLEYFSFSKWYPVLHQTIITSILTTFICVTSIILFFKKK